MSRRRRVDDIFRVTALVLVWWTSVMWANSVFRRRCGGKWLFASGTVRVSDGRAADGVMARVGKMMRIVMMLTMSGVSKCLLFS